MEWLSVIRIPIRLFRFGRAARIRLIAGFIAVAIGLGAGDTGHAQTPATTAPPAELVGRWLAEDIGGGGVIDRLQTTLEIRPEGTAGGNTGCNAYGSRIRVEGSRVTFTDVFGTLIACSGAVGDQERKFYSALAATQRFEINSLERKLILFGADGKPTMRLARL